MPSMVGIVEELDVEAVGAAEEAAEILPFCVHAGFSGKAVRC
jgi:hypothetical protein